MPDPSAEQMAERAADGLLDALVRAARPWLIDVLRGVFGSAPGGEAGDIEQMAAAWVARHRAGQRRANG